jgi:hypothetical protein
MVLVPAQMHFAKPGTVLRHPESRRCTIYRRSPISEEDLQAMREHLSRVLPGGYDCSGELKFWWAEICDARVLFLEPPPLPAATWWRPREAQIAVPAQAVGAAIGPPRVGDAVAVKSRSKVRTYAIVGKAGASGACQSGCFVLQPAALDA